MRSCKKKYEVKVLDKFLRISNPHKIGAPSPHNQRPHTIGEYMILILPSHDPIILMSSGMLCMGYLCGAYRPAAAETNT